MMPSDGGAGFPRLSIPRDHGGVRVLVTGDRGFVGAPVADFVRRRGYEVVGFDLADGADILDLAADPGRYRADPWAALVDCSAAATALGWRAAYRWSRRGTNRAGP
jgi:hypothetical protein